MENQSQAPQHRPQVVLVVIVSEFVGQDVPLLSLGQRGGVRCEVDGGAEQAKETGRGQALRLIDGQGAVRDLQCPAAFL